MPRVGFIAFLWILSFGQQALPPPYIARGNEVEQKFRSYRDRLDDFFNELRRRVASEAPELLPRFEDPPPEPVVYGYQLLPRIVDDVAGADSWRVSSFAYSWPATRGYIDGEIQKLSRVETGFRGAGPSTAEILNGFIGEYRTLVGNQRSIDGYIQYNRFWQREIASDRLRFDQLTALYELLMSGDEDTASQIESLLGMPDVPPFVDADRDGPDSTVLRVPVYTDIKDEAFLARAGQTIEGLWQAADSGGSFAVDIEFRPVDVARLYAASSVPAVGDPIDIASHVSRFPSDGAVLTTGAEATHGFVGRYVALGPGDISARTLAHEFGHVLGFGDGYVRGYRDLGEDGFEILELTTVFDDIMSAPREGRVLPAHFWLILDALRAP